MVRQYLSLTAGVRSTSAALGEMLSETTNRELTTSFMVFTYPSKMIPTIPSIESE